MSRSLLVRDSERENVLNELDTLNERLRALERRVAVQEQQATMFDDMTDAERAYPRSASSIALMPRLRGLWAMASVDSAGDAYDISGQGRTLTNNNTITFNADGLMPYANFVAASSQFFSRAHETGLNPTGSMWLNGWVYFGSASMGVTTGIISKWVTAGNQRAFRIFKNTADVIAFQVSSNGTAETTISSLVAAKQDKWYGITAVYEVSTRVTLWINGTKYENTTSIPASIFNATSANFEIGRTNAGNYLGGRVSLCALGGRVLPDAIASSAFQQARWAFGV